MRQTALRIVITARPRYGCSTSLALMMYHKHLHLYTFTFMAMCLAGCPDDPAPTVSTTTAPSAPQPAASSAAPAASSSATPKIAGILSEKDFQALHQLKGGDAPPPRGEMIDLAGGKAYLTLPTVAKPPLPAVIVIHEWWGLNGHIKHWADRLTEDGYAAIAVDLYGGKVAEEPAKAMELMKAVDAEAARKTLVAAFEFLGSDPRVAAEKRASIGWCFGGKWSLELALAAPKLTAAVVYYGHVETNPERLATLQAPLLGIFGEKDEGIPPDYVDKFRFGLEQAGDKEVKILTYEAEHAFANPSSARYDFDAAQKAWSETRGFLGKHLKGPH